MPSSEQYVFGSPESQYSQSQEQPNLLPEEFTYPGSTAGNTTVATDYTSAYQPEQYVDNTGTGIVSNNSGIVDSSGSYVVDQGGQYVPYDATTSTNNGGLPQMDGSYSTNVAPGAIDATSPQQQQGQVMPDGTQWVPQNTGELPINNGGMPMDQSGTQVAPMPENTSNASSDSKSSGGGIDAMWWADRGLSLGATGLAATKYIPNLSTFVAEGSTIPSLSAVKSIPKGEWSTAIRTDLGKAMGGAWLGDTVLDATLLKDRETSWKTLAVDIATPFLANRFLPGLGLGKTIALSLGAHAAEKMFLEDKKES